MSTSSGAAPTGNPQTAPADTMEVVCRRHGRGKGNTTGGATGCKGLFGVFWPVFVASGCGASELPPRLCGITTTGGPTMRGFHHQVGVHLWRRLLLFWCRVVVRLLARQFTADAELRFFSCFCVSCRPRWRREAMFLVCCIFFGVGATRPPFHVASKVQRGWLGGKETTVGARVVFAGCLPRRRGESLRTRRRLRAFSCRGVRPSLRAEARKGILRPHSWDAGTRREPSTGPYGHRALQCRQRRRRSVVQWRRGVPSAGLVVVVWRRRRRHGAVSRQPLAYSPLGRGGRTFEVAWRGRHRPSGRQIRWWR